MRRDGAEGLTIRIRYGYIRATCFNKALSHNSILASKFTIERDSVNKQENENKKYLRRSYIQKKT